MSSGRAVYASVRIAGESLDPLEVTKALRLPADHVQRRGEPRLRRRRDGSVREDAAHREGMWSMCSASWVDSDELDVHLRWLLDQLEPRRTELQRLLDAGAWADIFCYSAAPNERATPLPGSTLGRCAALCLPVSMDHYAVDQSDSRDE